MENPVHRLRRVHRFLTRQALYPLLLSSLLAIGLFAGRVYRSHTLAHAGLMWNLFLAWIPYLASLWAAYIHKRHPSHWWRLLAPGVLWLVFLPNAPYIVTDFWHLRELPPIPFWYDIGMLTAFAWSGLFLAVHSLRTMQRLVKRYTGSLLSWAFVLVVVGLNGLGIYLGRFLRWNSWDLLLHPRGVLRDVVARLAHPLGNLQTYGVTLLFAAILFVCYLTLVSPESEHTDSLTR